jgi:hypothetical protein
MSEYRKEKAQWSQSETAKNAMVIKNEIKAHNLLKHKQDNAEH